MAEKPQKGPIVKKYDEGQVICHEGDEGQDMFIIKSGKVNVMKEIGQEDMVLATLGQKEFFGEMALFGVPKRTATVKAAEPTEVVTVTRQMLHTQYKKVPEWLVSMIKTIASRIISTQRGVKRQYKVSVQYTLLKAIALLGNVKGTATHKGFTIPVSVLRDELMYTLGIRYEEIDVWLKRFNLVNLVKVLGGKGLAEIPDVNRLNKYIEYLYAISPEGKQMPKDIDSEMMKSFERMTKLLDRK